MTDTINEAINAKEAVLFACNSMNELTRRFGEMLKYCAKNRLRIVNVFFEPSAMESYEKKCVKCDEEMYNEMKTEIVEKRENLEKTIARYNSMDIEIDDICEKIIDVAANAGKILKSPIISLKRDFLRLILSDFFTDGKNVVFSITKPFDKQLRTAEINKWRR